MRPFGAWYGRLAIAGACLLGAGCGGGGDIPDPDSDSHAASDSAPRGPAPKKVEVAEAEAPQPEPAVVASKPPIPDNTFFDVPPAASKPGEKAAEPDKSTPALKGDASGTDDMLRMSANPGSAPVAPGLAPGAPGAPGAPAAPGSAPGAGLAGPGQPGAPGAAGGPGDSGANRRRPGDANANGPMPMASPGPLTGPGGGGGPPGGPNTPGAPGFPGAAGGPGIPGAGGGPGAVGMGVQAMGAPGSPGGPGASGFGGLAGPGGAAGQDPLLQGNAAFRLPATAVQAFLAALKAKDKDRLSQTIALRAQHEASEKHKKIFAAIAEGTISDDELDEMSKSLEGYQVSSQLPAYSTGKIGVLVSRMTGRERSQRTITTRREKEGWKVFDVDSGIEFKSNMSRGRRSR